MIKLNNINIESISPLVTPAEIKAMYPASEDLMRKVYDSRNELRAIFDRKSDRHIMIAGPCSIHNTEAATEYAERLLKLKEKFSDRLMILMRVYFEKPRTTIGWKGMIYDPDLNDSGDIEKGLRMARKLLCEIVGMGMPVATEILEPIIPQYIADLISWTAIGARTTESQTHRQMTSGLSMPTGFKNSTDGSAYVAINAIKSAASKHSFIGITEDGRAGIFRSKGNKYGHLVLRGGENYPNYASEYIAFTKVVMTKAGLTPNIIVDCSHANARKQPQRQLLVLRDIMEQIAAGETAIRGTMLESNLLPDSQPINSCPIAPGISITDPCIGWEETENIITELYNSLGRKK